jgi:hypothetical protein
MNYSFPPTKWVKTGLPTPQLNHILSEVREVEGSEHASMHELEEIVDLYHSIETYFRIQEKLGVNVDEVFINVFLKNEVRGYYEGVE